MTVHDINQAAGEIATERHGNYNELEDTTAYDREYMRLCDLVDENEELEDIKQTMLDRE